MNQFIVFYDGCHKIYYAHEYELEEIGKMVMYGYDPIRIHSDGDVRHVLQNLWENSCSLRFIEPASLDPKLPWLAQFDDDIDSFLDEFYSYWESRT